MMDTTKSAKGTPVKKTAVTVAALALIVPTAPAVADDSEATVTILSEPVNRPKPKPKPRYSASATPGHQPVTAPASTGAQFDGKSIDAAVRAGLSAQNGRLPSSALCNYRSTVLRCDAALALSKVNEGFHTVFGRHLDVGQGYRDFAGQVAVKRSWAARGAPGMAATPGTSNHGLGMAMDLSGPEAVAGTPEHKWLIVQASKRGWVWPCWARPGGVGPQEDWHFEFQGKGVNFPDDGNCSS